MTMAKSYMSEWEIAEQNERYDHIARLILRGANPEELKVEFSLSRRESDLVRHRAKRARRAA